MIKLIRMIEKSPKDIAKLLTESMKNPPKEVIEAYQELEKRVREGLNGPGPDIGNDRMSF